jgi:hypothetical protein
VDAEVARGPAGVEPLGRNLGRCSDPGSERIGDAVRDRADKKIEQRSISAQAASSSGSGRRSPGGRPIKRRVVGADPLDGRADFLTRVANADHEHEAEDEDCQFSDLDLVP